MKSQQTFEEFIAHAEAELRRAYAWNMKCDDIPRAVSEAMSYAWLHRRRVQRAANPVGFLYRVGQAQAGHTRHRWQTWHSDMDVPDIEPDLLSAMASLPRAQAAAVWLVRACGWTNIQAGEALGTSPAEAAAAVSLGMDQLHTQLGLEHD